MFCVLRDILYAVLVLAATPWLLYRFIAQGRYRCGWAERFGFVRQRTGQQPRCIWIHAVSVGEINAIGSLVKELEQQFSEHEIVISTTTDTGMARARKLYGPTNQVFFFPWDFSFTVARAFTRLQPAMCIMMEGEVWPNFTAVAKARYVPVVVANGRVGAGKGWRRYRKIAPLVRPMFSRLALVLAQDEEHAQRFRFLGTPAERVIVTGSLKYDTAEVGDKAPGTDELAQQLRLPPSAMLWVAGSTGPGEEEIVLDCLAQLQQEKKLQPLRLVIVPRKPERFDEIARLIKSRGFDVLRYRRIKTGDYQASQMDDTAVILGDTMGDLRKFYSLASVTFVGRSLVPMGGSDMMEAAGLAKPVVVGPYTENFAQAVKLLMAATALEIVPDGRQLATIVKRLLLNKNAAHEMGQRARQVIIDNQGATHRTVKAITKLLKK